MRGTASNTVQRNTDEHLVIAHYREAHDAVINYLTFAETWVLWRDIFDEDVTDMKIGAYYDLTLQLVGRVHQTLFPVDLEYMDQVMESGDNPMRYPIPIEGIRIPWEIAPLSDLEPCDQAIAAAIRMARGDEMDSEYWWWEELGILFDFDDKDNISQFDLYFWWLNDVGSDDHELAVPHLARIAALPGPESAIADLVLACLAPSNNPFYDTCTYALEYFAREHYWVADDVRALARFYKEAEPILRRVRRYREWWREMYEEDGEVDGHVAVLKILGLEVGND